MVGHVDFKFVLNSNITNIPQIQVTLLKNKAPGLGKVNGKKELEESFTVFFFSSKSVFSLRYVGRLGGNYVNIFIFYLFHFYSVSQDLVRFFHLTC